MRTFNVFQRLGFQLLASCSIFLALAGSLYAGVKTEPIPGGTRYVISIDDVTYQEVTINNLKFTEAKLVGVDGYEGIIYREGQPKIPVIRLYFSGDAQVVPGNLGLKALKAPTHYPLVPVQPSSPKIKGFIAPFAFDEKAYKVPSFFPEEPFAIESVGSIQGRQQKMLTLHPVTYNAASNEFKIRSTFTVEVRSENPPLSKAGGREVMVFIVGQKFANSPALRSFQAFKKTLGYTIREFVTGTESGITTPEQIRTKLKAILTEEGSNLKHALIIGDVEDVPALTSTNITGVTDHYYRAIDTSDYNGDINGPDIGVGRTSVSSEAQLDAVLAKYMHYEQGIFNNEDWLNSIAFLATNDKYEVAEGSHNYVIDTYTKNAGYVGIFPEATNPGGDKLYAITHKVPNDVVQSALRQGRTIVDYSGHGATTFWDAPRVSQDNVRALAHADALPFVISNACVTGNFRIDESFAETWQRHPNGSIMFWGSMDSSYWDEDDILERRMFDGIYKYNKQDFASITDYSMLELWKQYGGGGRTKYYWETYVTFGDPSIKLRTTKTKTLNVDGPIELPLGLSEVTYRVTDSAGTPIPNARVALSLRDGVYGAVGYTNQDGQVIIQLKEGIDNVNEFDLTVLGHNTKLYRGELKIIPNNSPFFKITNVIANGHESRDVHLGEGVTLLFKVQNIGRVGTLGGEVTLESIEGPAILLDRASVVIPELPAGEFYQITGDALKFKVNDEAQPGQAVTAKITWKTSEGQTGKVSASFRILRGALQVSGLDYGENTDPNEFGIKPGDVGDVFITVKNVGNEPMSRVVLTPQLSTCVTEASGDLAIEQLAPSATLRIATPITVRLSSSCQNGDSAEVKVAGTYDSLVLKPAISGQVGLTVGHVSMVQVDALNINMAIPDFGEPITKTIDVTNTGVIQKIGIYVNIAHTYIGDLIVKLYHPDGTEVVLHNRTGNSSDNIQQIYGDGGEALSALLFLKGKPIQGTWKVTVQDKAKTDTGTLKDLKLFFKGYVD